MHKGNYLFGLDYPEQDAIMNFVELEATRKTFYIAFSQRGGQANLDILKEATVLRLELAKLMGDASFADWAIKRKMAGNAAAVNRFLDDVQGRVEALERKEIEELRQEKIAFTGKPDAVLKSWDTGFFQTASEESPLQRGPGRSARPIPDRADDCLDDESHQHLVRREISG